MKKKTELKKTMGKKFRGLRKDERKQNFKILDTCLFL